MYIYARTGTGPRGTIAGRLHCGRGPQCSFAGQVNCAREWSEGVGGTGVVVETLEPLSALELALPVKHTCHKLVVC